MATYVGYGGTTVAALQTGHDFRYQHVLEPLFNGFAPSHFNPVPVASALKGGTVGTAYSATISAQGGTTPYSFAVTSGALPAGTSLNSSTGVISGTPTTVGSASFTITVTDASSFTGATAFTIVIAAPVTVPPTNYGYTA